MNPAPIVLKSLLHPSFDFDALAWEPFRPGVEIHRLYGDQRQGGSAALLRYQPHSGMPLHEHSGYEHVFILARSQSDGSIENSAGTLVIYPPGTRHEIRAEKGCIALVIWQGPVRFDVPEDG